ncbi:chemotaxis protein CheA [Pantoea agglomerans]|uniref:chemotaxis protein CheA n=1 Tax=Enterobacter agglomerans TaxID=549 RepID=UPI001050815D|nr:chemotaxis protein CheA [Pantoea agglomerans]TCZ24253.1 chemotaxis protein CheA [Pantoea agglomerans]
MEINDFSGVFFSEAEELLAEMEQQLLKLNVDRPDAEELNAIFRAAHSLKGGAGTFGFSLLQQTTHLLENILDNARSGRLTLTRTIINLFLQAKDIMQAQLEAYKTSQEPDEAGYLYITEALQQIALQEKASALPDQADSGNKAIRNSAESLLTVLIKDVDAEEQILLKEELTHLGELVDVSSTPTSLSVRLLTSASGEDIVCVLCFILDESQITVRPEEVCNTPDGNTDTPAVANTQIAQSSRPSPPETGNIRVAVSKVDQIINQVGELIITQAMLTELTSHSDTGSSDRLQQCVAQLERNTRELQESVMSVRMMPMDYVFSRFPRLVHDLGARLNKEVELILIGGTAELDKSLIERIIDPLTHLVRNSLDHGIEPVDERVAKGKPATGKLTLSAEHHGGNIIIEVSDDGAGLNREKILQKARSQGLIVSDTLSDEEVWMLIFSAGFSTAESVTDVSGRGVGMDVVRRNINAMGGHVDVSSRLNAGTTVRILLPLTLAILDGMLVQVEEEIYVLPLGAVMESLRPTPQMIRGFVGGDRLLHVRGEYLPLIRLRERLRVSDPTESADGIVVIVQSAGYRYALCVDQLIGQQQVVVKNLEQNYRKVQGISAATILGNGSVALILDVAELFAFEKHKKKIPECISRVDGVTT